MSSLFGNYAIKESLGATHFIGNLALESLATGTASVRPSETSADTPSATEISSSGGAGMSLEEQLFDANADAKIFASKVAMRMAREWKSGLYRQLDSILDADEWLEGDHPLQLVSWVTFIRLMLVLRPKVRPGLGLTSGGHVIAMWTEDRTRLTVECQPQDTVRWVYSHMVEGQRETVAGDTSIQRLPLSLSPYNLNDWLEI